MRNNKIIKPLCFLLCLSSFCAASGWAQTVRYPSAGDIYTVQHRYPLALLKLALSYSGEAYQLEPSSYFMSQGRALKQLQQSKDLEVLWTMTSKQREAQVLPIRIPIYKGLIGWRIFLQGPKVPARFERSMDALKQLRIVQGHDWPDTPILRANGFNVAAVPNYESMFEMLSLGRVDLFPRAVIEIWDELDQHASANIQLEPALLISYPAATYFFVSFDNPALAQVIETGLLKAIEDERFDALFEEFFGDMIARAQMEQRTHYRLNNPLIPEATPLNDLRLWFRLD